MTDHSHRVVAQAVRRSGSRAAVADWLGVAPAVVDDWLRGATPLPDHHRERLRGLLRVLDRLDRVPRDRVPPAWLSTPCAGLDGATPADVLAVDGPGRVLDAIEREFA